MSEDAPSSSSWSISAFKRWLSTTPETREELIQIIKNSHEILRPETIEMLEGVFDLPATQVREIMTPRPNVVGAHEAMCINEVIDLFLESSHSRYPVFDSQDDDAVIGILLAKDLIPLLVNNIRSAKDSDILDNSSHIAIKSLVHQPIYINENAKSDKLLRSLQKAQVHMAVVVDNYGNFAGIVTMEDLLEEIVGEIVDEHDDLDDSDFNNIIAHATKPHTWIVQASTLIDDCNERLGTQFENQDVDTIGGIVMQSLGNVSELQNQKVTIDNWQFTTLDVDGRFIQTIELRNLTGA